MIMFKVHARDMKLMLDCLKPVIVEIAECNKVLNNQPMEEQKVLKDLESQMEEGAILVQNCSKVGAWSFVKKYKYNNRLFKLDQSLHTLLRVLELQKTRDIKETLDSVKNIETVVHRIEGNISAMHAN